MIWNYDEESYPNLFVAVFKSYPEGEYRTFILWDDQINQIKELIIFLTDEKPTMSGFGNLGYDAQLLEFIIDNQNCTAAEIKAFSNETIESKKPKYPAYKLRTRQIDLYKIWHYDNNARRTSLKWLEYMYRMRTIRDLPYEHDKTITSQTQVDAIVKYCKHDVDATEKHYETTRSRLKLRARNNKKYGVKMLNMPDASMGAELLLSILSKKMNIPVYELRKGRTQRTHINIKDVIFDYYWNLPITQNVINNYFKPMRIISTLDPESGNNVYDFKVIPNYFYNW